MAASIDIVFRKDKILKKKGEEKEITKDQKAPLHIRIIKNRKVRYIATGYKIESKFWDDDKRKVKNNYPNSVRLNNYLNHLKVEYQNEVLKQETQDTTISTKQLKKKITGNNDTDFFLVADGIIKRYLLDNKTRTYNSGRSIIEKMKSFIQANKLPIEEISTVFLSNYENHLKSKLKNKINTINKDLRFIRRVFNEAHRLGLVSMDKNPFLKYKLRTEKTNKIFLNEKELLALENLELVKGSKMELHRDMFIFSAYAGGLRVSDTLLLQWKNFDGTHINFSIQKTNNPLSIKIPDKALKIIKKYKENKPSAAFIFPMLQPTLNLKDMPVVNQAISSATAYINKNLKAIASKAEIGKHISFHSARHTWATLALRKGISIDKVSKLMGHAAIKETQIYAKLVNEELDKAMDSFNL